MQRGWIETFWQDIRYGSRRWRRNPGFTAIVVLTLALGIGVNTAMFSIVNGVLLRPLPYPEPQRLVQISKELTSKNKRQRTAWLNYDEVVAWTKAAQLPVQVAAHALVELNLAGGNEALRVTCGSVSAGFLTVLGVTQMIGRNFLPAEDRAGSAPVAILSHGLWQRQFGSNPQVINQTIRLDQKSYTVIGVLPEGIQLPEPYEVLLPLALGRAAREAKPMGGGWWCPWAFGRLRPGINRAQAQAALDNIYQSVRDPKEQGHIVLSGLLGDMEPGAQRELVVLLGAVGLVLLIATANVANLLLARAASQQKEIALRSALGAGRRRIMRQLLTESVLLALLGGMLGLLLAVWTMHLLKPLIAHVSTVQTVGLNGWVLAFTFLVTLVTGLLCGVAPAWAASRAPVSEALKEGSHGVTGGVRQRRLRQLLVVSEIALAVLLLLGAGLLLQSFVRLRSVDPGFRPARLLSFTIDLTAQQYPDARTQAAYFAQVIERLRSLPGVEAVGANSMLPLTQAGTFFIALEIEGQPDASAEMSIGEAKVNGEYFRALGIPLLRGRSFTDQDRMGAPEVVVVSESVVRRYFPNTDPLGKRMRNRFGGGWQTIVGVVGDVHQFDLETWEGNLMPQVYRCYLQAAMPVMSLAIKTKGHPVSLTRAVQSHMMSVDKNQPATAFRTMEQRLAATLATRRLHLLLLGSFALLALGLAAIGIYGVVAYSVVQRTHEIGVRMALGASRQAVRGLVLRQGILLAGAGVGLGLLGGLGMTRLIASQLYGVGRTDPATFTVVAVVLIGAALLASWWPARRATIVDPLVALRGE